MTASQAPSGRSSAESSERDEDLVRRAAGGDGAAFDALVRKYQDRVYNLCYRMCHNQADALDLAQAAFLKAYRNLPRFQERSSFYTWLFRVATNVVLSERRYRARRPVRTLGNGGPDGGSLRLAQPASDERADGPLQAAETRARIESALARLEDDFRVVVILKDVEDMDYETIATVLDLPLGTVKSRLHRARMELRELLREE